MKELADSEWQQAIAQWHYRLGETALIKTNKENYTPSQKEKQGAETDVTWQQMKSKTKEGELFYTYIHS